MSIASATAGQHRSSTRELALPSRDRWFVLICALVFIVGVAVTIDGCEAMGSGMPMQGGWTMSMVWMRMPGQSWLSAYGMFLWMWSFMMAAMMAPALAIALIQFRRIYNASPKLNRQTVAVAIGYVSVWVLLGLVLFPIGVGVARFLMLNSTVAQLVPVASTVILLLAGHFQLTRWKTESLCRCGSVLIESPTTTLRIANSWRMGIVIGKHCLVCCSGLMVVLVVTGVMNLVSMAVVTIAITVERFHAKSERIARVIGSGIVMFALCHAYGTWLHW